jgi:hypothetical protein
MRTDLPLHSLGFAGIATRALAVLTLAVAVLGGGLDASAQASDAAKPKPQAAHRRSGAHAKPHAGKPKAAEEAPAVSAPVVAKPAAPELPAWPANEKAAPATITWDSHGLRIAATNASLQEILQQVAKTTGADVEGLGDDARVYGVYGPGTARDVISELLLGSGYNVLMIGDQGEGTPRQIVLSSRHPGETAAAPGGGEETPASDDDADSDDQPAPPVRPGFNNGGPARSPRQVMEEMRQRQQQMQQQNNNPQE